MHTGVGRSGQRQTLLKKLYGGRLLCAIARIPTVPCSDDSANWGSTERARADPVQNIVCGVAALCDSAYTNAGVGSGKGYACGGVLY